MHCRHGKVESSIFTTLDLTLGLWQMPIHSNSISKTAFTLPDLGQFERLMSPMGLLGCPARIKDLWKCWWKEWTMLLCLLMTCYTFTNSWTSSGNPWPCDEPFVWKQHEDQPQQVFFWQHRNQLSTLQTYTKQH
jgi:hypothetical protein